MNKIVRVVVTVVAFIVSVFFLGAVTIAAGSDKGALYGVISFAIIVGIPYLVWWATGRMSPVNPPKEPPSGKQSQQKANL